jgi:hypothetical protein
LERQGLTAPTLATGLADPVATTALVFGTDFDQTAATDRAAGNVRQFHDDRIATKDRWFGRWSDFLIHSLVSISSIDSSNGPRVDLLCWEIPN